MPERIPGLREPSSWTPAREQLLRELWAEGLATSTIAKRLGGTTKNAVVGKAHRLGLPRRPSAVKRSS